MNKLFRFCKEISNELFKKFILPILVWVIAAIVFFLTGFVYNSIGLPTLPVKPNTSWIELHLLSGCIFWMAILTFVGTIICIITGIKHIKKIWKTC